MSQLSRRNLLKGLAGGAVVAGSSAAISSLITNKSDSSVSYDFFGEYQAGIVSKPQEHLLFLSFDLTTASRDEVVSLLKSWTVLSSDLVNANISNQVESYDAPPADTGETRGAGKSSLTITYGFGPTFFIDNNGHDRYKVSHAKPIELRRLPVLPADQLDESASNGDICIQICGESPIAVFHAGRNLTRAGFGKAQIRWSQSGFAGKVPGQPKFTPRNLFGFKDGTGNPHNSEVIDAHVWVDSPQEPRWFQGGTYLAARKIRMNIETWDRSSLREQENIIGRTKDIGAPLSGGEEFTPPDLEMKTTSGKNIIPKDSHVAIAHSSNFGGHQMLRRPYNYDDGIDQLGRLNAGTLFIAFQKSLEKNFIPVLSALAMNDSMNEYIKHIGSSVFAVAPGVRNENDFIGSGIFI